MATSSKNTKATGENQTKKATPKLSKADEKYYSLLEQCASNEIVMISSEVKNDQGVVLIERRFDANGLPDMQIFPNNKAAQGEAKRNGWRPYKPSTKLPEIEK